MDNKSIFEQARRDFDKFIIKGAGKLNTQELTTLSYHLDGLSGHDARERYITETDSRLKLKRNLAYGISFSLGALIAGGMVTSGLSLGALTFLSSVAAVTSYSAYQIDAQSYDLNILAGEPKYAHLLRIRMLLAKGLGVEYNNPILSTQVIEDIAGVAASILRTELRYKVSDNEIQASKQVLSFMDNPVKYESSLNIYRAANNYRMISELREMLSKNHVAQGKKGLGFSVESESARSAFIEIIESELDIDLNDLGLITDKSLYNIANLIYTAKQDGFFLTPEQSAIEMNRVVHKL